jgi:hypothetical protein
MTGALRRRVRNILISIDPWTSGSLRLKEPVYTEDPNLLTGAGVYSAEEWSSSRRKGAVLCGRDGSQYDNDHKYLEYIFHIESMKVLSAICLASHFDFGKYDRVIEIGCGDMPQALVVKNMFPDLQYLATDYDPYVIARCSDLSILKNIEKAVFDASGPNLDVIEGCELLLSWGVDYALEDKYLLRLLCACKEHRICFLLCSPSIIGLIRLLIHIVRKRADARKLSEHNIRMHGWSRSLGSFRHLARRAGMRMEVIGKCGSYLCLLFTP